MGPELDEAAKIIGKIDALSGSVANLYALQSQGIVGLFNDALLFEPTPLTVRQFSHKAAVMLGYSIELINNAIDDGIKHLSDGTMLSDYLNESSDAIKQQIADQMGQDINQVKTDLFRYVMAMSNGQLFARLRVSSAINARKTVNFKHVDRIGRRGNARAYVSAVISNWIVEAIYDAFYAIAIKEGMHTIHLSNGELLGVDNYYTDEAMRHRHPNTKTIPISIS